MSNNQVIPEAAVEENKRMTITEFLEARIAEDEAMARQEEEDYADTTLLPTYDSEHQANWNTARVLAECAAKRAIIEPFRLAHKEPAELHPMISDMAWLFLRPLAAIYKDHPDYQQEWTK